MNKGVSLGGYIRILVVMIMIVGMSALFHNNEANAATSANLLEAKVMAKQYVSTQRNNDVSSNKNSVQPALLTQKSNHLTTVTQPEKAQSVRNTQLTSNHVITHHASRQNTANIKTAPKQPIVQPQKQGVSNSQKVIQPTKVTHKSINPTATTQSKSKQYIKHAQPSTNHSVQSNSQKNVMAKNKGIASSKQTIKPKLSKTVQHKVKSKAIQSRKSPKSIQHKASSKSVKSPQTTKKIHPTQKKPKWLSTATTTKKSTTTKKPTTTSKSVKTQSSRTSSLSKTKKTPITQPSTKVAVKTATQTKTAKNYYNQPPKRWPSNVPGGDNVRDFGQTTKESGIDDALKIMKKSGNSGVTIEHTKAKDANIAMVYNWNPTTKKLEYGTGTAIGKHTILTANHVVNDRNAHRPLSPAQPQNMRIVVPNAKYGLEVLGVQMLQYGDVALVYTFEDLSKYMTIRKIASEKTIQSMKANTPIHMYHYGNPSGKYKNDPQGTMYHSKGKYSMAARNVNPIGYYQMMAEPGSSGGAVLNSKNEIIGVHAFRIDSGDYKKYHLNTMAEIRGKLRKEIISNIA